MKRALPVGLQVSTNDDTYQLPMGFIATRVELEHATEGWVLDVAYPFLLMESEGRALLAFATPGPDPSVREEIVAAFVERLTRAVRAG